MLFSKYNQSNYIKINFRKTPLEVTQQEKKRILFEIYPELKETDNSLYEAYLNIISEQTSSYNYDSYYEAVEAGYKLLKYTPKDEALFMITCLSHPLLLSHLPASYQTARMWDIFLKIIDVADVTVFYSVMERISSKLISKYFNHERGLLLISRINSYGEGYSLSDFIDRLLSPVILGNREFLSSAIEQGIPFKLLDPYFKRHRVKIDVELAKPYLKHFQDNYTDIVYLPADVREELITPELAKKLIKLNPDLLQYIPLSQCNEALYLQALKHNGLLLRNIPTAARNLKIYQTALKENGESLIYISVEERTMELYLLAIKKTPRMLKQLPEELHTFEICKMAIQIDYGAIRYLAPSVMSKELCKLAVQKNKNAYKLIPEVLKDKELTDMAVKQLDTKQQFRAFAKYIPSELLIDYPNHG